MPNSRRERRSRDTPATSSAPSSRRRTSVGHTRCSTRALVSSGARSQAGPRLPASAVEGAGLVRAHGVTSARAPRRRAARARWRARAGRVDERPAGPRWSRLRRPRRPAAAPGTRRRTCGRRGAVVLEVAGDPVRLAQLGRARDHRGNSASARSRSPSRACDSSAGSKSRPAPATRPRSAALRRMRAQPRVGVLHVEDRVVARSAGSTRRRRGRAASRPGSVPARSAPRRRRSASTRSSRVTSVPARLLIRSGSPSREEVDELADQHLEVVRAGSSPSAGRHRLQPADVAVVVGAEQVDAPVEPARRLSR